MADSQVAQDNEPKRHCAFCLLLKPFKVCTSCRRRAYCSVTCQKQDWKSSGNGQGHKNWCNIEHGQEDIDWEVRPIPGKGLGIVAKRLIPSKYWIIVEGLHFDPESHPAIADLTPEGGSLEDKFNSNAKHMRGVDEPCVLLRTSHVNHSCTPNAGLVYCNTSNVSILYACRDIQEGEEICYAFFDIVHDCALNADYCRFPADTHVDVVKDALEKLYGITCPAECVCNSAQYKLDVTKASKLFKTFEKQRHSNRALALETGEKILALMNDKLYATWEAKANIHAQCEEATRFSKEIDVFRAGLDHGKKAGDIYSEILPLSRKIKDYVKGNDLFELLWGAPLPNE